MTRPRHITEMRRIGPSNTNPPFAVGCGVAEHRVTRLFKHGQHPQAARLDVRREDGGKSLSPPSA
jgi:hypothetical protein